MRASVVEGRVEDHRVETAWRAAIRGQAALSSPYFDPAYFRAVASVRDDVYLLVVEDAGEVVALLPFQRRPGGVGGPVGGPINDFQSLLTVRDVPLEPAWLVKQAGLHWLRFDHWICAQARFMTHRAVLAPSPVIDLSGGMDGYLAGRQREGRATAARLRAKVRRIERDLGPLRFEWDVRRPEVLAWVMATKTAQARRVGSALLFERPWAREVVARIHQTRTPSFQGLLSAAWAGDHLVAAHMGMRAGPVLHYWFPAYDRSLQPYSSGLVLLWRVMEEAASQGILRIDLGKGEHAFKDRLKTHDEHVAEGWVAASAAVTRGLEGAARVRGWASGGALGQRADRALLRVRRFLRYR